MTGWDERIAQLEAEFPGWHIWRSNAGRWWATRTGSVLRREDLGTGRVMTLDADDERGMRDQLAGQAALTVNSKASRAPRALRSPPFALARYIDGHWQSTNASASESSVPAAASGDGRATPKRMSSVTSAPSSHSGSSGAHSHAERSVRARIAAATCAARAAGRAIPGRAATAASIAWAAAH